VIKNIAPSNGGLTISQIERSLDRELELKTLTAFKDVEHGVHDNYQL
jgi:hypothetical protein